MYKEFYKLQEEPFGLTPNPHFLYLTAQHREALSGLVYSVCTRRGLTVLVGEVGTGKTTVIYALQELLGKQGFSIAYCVNPTLDRNEFHDFLLARLNVRCSSLFKSRQLMALERFLLRRHAAGKPSILIIDEAQRLSTEILEEIRLLLNLETASEKLLQIIISGQPELAEIFQRTELRQLKQRISYWCRLHPLTPEELKEYVHHRLSCAGLPDPDLFPEETLDAVYGYTGGIPRSVNTLCDNALRIGFALQSPHITVSIIQEAAMDLLPSLQMPEMFRGDGEKVATLGVPRNGTNAMRRVFLGQYAALKKSAGFIAGFLDPWR